MEPQVKFFDAPSPAGMGTHRIAYAEWGDPANPKVLVCVHGLTRNFHDFDYLARRLAGEWRVICPDMPGRGQSEWLPRLEWYVYPTYMADCLGLLEHLGITRCAWFGTSMGGLIGMMLAAGQPGLIRMLAMNDIGPLIPAAGLSRIGEYVGTRMRFADDAEYRAYYKDIMVSFGVPPGEPWEHVLRHSARHNADGSVDFLYDPAIGNVFRDKEGKPLPLQDVNLWAVWKAVRCPVLVLRGGASDILTAETARHMVAEKPHVIVREFPGIGHAPMVMDDAQIGVVKEWLASYPHPEQMGLAARVRRFFLHLAGKKG